MAHTVTIYSITHMSSNRVYIGSTINWRTRKREHLNDLRKNKHHSPFLQRAWNKYGEEEFEFSVITTCDEKNRLELEQYYIDNSRSTFNLCRVSGTTTGFRFKMPPRDPEHTAKIVAALSGRKLSPEQVEKMRQLARPISPEHRAVLNEAIKGKTKSEEHKKKIGEASRSRYGKNQNFTFKGRHHTSEAKDSMAGKLVGRPSPKPDGWRENVRKGKLGVKLSSQHKINIGIGVRRYWKKKNAIHG